MALFKPYQRPADQSQPSGTAAPLTAEDVIAAKQNSTSDPKAAKTFKAKKSAVEPIDLSDELVEPDALASQDKAPKPTGKQAPTPTRKQAEAARMERLHPTLNKKEQKQRNRAAAVKERERSQELFEAAPERVLLRNYVDSRWTFSEFVWPLLLILMAFAMIGIRFPQVLPFSTVLAWITMLGMVIDVWVVWRGLKRELAARYPRAKKSGLLGYLMSRMMTPRRWRQPGTAVSREPLIGGRKAKIDIEDSYRSDEPRP